MLGVLVGGWVAVCTEGSAQCTEGSRPETQPVFHMVLDSTGYHLLTLQQGCMQSTSRLRGCEGIGEAGCSKQFDKKNNPSLHGQPCV